MRIVLTAGSVVKKVGDCEWLSCRLPKRLRLEMSPEPELQQYTWVVDGDESDALKIDWWCWCGEWCNASVLQRVVVWMAEEEQMGHGSWRTYVKNVPSHILYIITVLCIYIVRTKRTYSNTYTSTLSSLYVKKDEVRTDERELSLRYSRYLASMLQ